MKDIEKQLATIFDAFDRLVDNVSEQEGSVISILEKIRSLKHENERIVGRACELKGIIGMKIEIMVNALKEAKETMVASDLVNIDTNETLSYLLCLHITILESFKRFWDTNLSMLKRYFVDIFQFM